MYAVFLHFILVVEMTLTIDSISTVNSFCLFFDFWSYLSLCRMLCVGLLLLLFIFVLIASNKLGLLRTAVSASNIRLPNLYISTLLWTPEPRVQLSTSTSPLEDLKFLSSCSNMNLSLSPSNHSAHSLPHLSWTQGHLPSHCSEQKP